jgi:hypothetical protein
MSFRQHFHHLTDLLNGDVTVTWRRDWLYLLVAGGLILATGPWSLLGCWIQQWNTQTNPWDGKSHWDGTRQFAFTFAFFDLLLVAAVIRFYPQLSSRWSASLFTWLFSPLVLWYLFWALLAPLYALLAERIDPRKIRMRRVRAPAERQVPKPAHAEEGDAQPGRDNNAAATRSVQAASMVPQKKKRTKGRSVPPGVLLPQELAERERGKASSSRFVQAPLLVESEGTPGEVSTASTNGEPSRGEKPEPRKPEPLNDLF